MKLTSYVANYWRPAGPNCSANAASNRLRPEAPQFEPAHQHHRAATLPDRFVPSARRPTYAPERHIDTPRPQILIPPLQHAQRPCTDQLLMYTALKLTFLLQTGELQA